jgi:hypothetical protein
MNEKGTESLRTFSFFNFNQLITITVTTQGLPEYDNFGSVIVDQTIICQLDKANQFSRCS